MDSIERWQGVADGMKPDRPPMSFWRHFYDQENKLDTFVESMVGFQRRFGWDFVKINPKASYHVEPWGAVVEPSPDGIAKPQKKSWPVNSVGDLENIGVVPTNHPEFARQLSAISRIRKAIPQPLPVVMTMFTPLSVLGDLVPDGETLVALIGEAPVAVNQALRNITETLTALAVEFLNAGADGLFYATTEWASTNLLTWKQYSEYGKGYDLRITDAIADDASFNVLHICAPNNFLRQMTDYPATVVNWDASDPTNVPLREGWQLLQRPVMGGLDRYKDLLELTPQTLSDKTKSLVHSHRDLPFAVGPGCAVPVTVPLDQLDVVKQAVIDASR